MLRGGGVFQVGGWLGSCGRPHSFHENTSLIYSLTTTTLSTDPPAQPNPNPTTPAHPTQLDAPNQDKYRVVGFRVRPFSINHRAEGGDGAWRDMDV